MKKNKINNKNKEKIELKTENEMIIKLCNNKLLLFLIPNLISWYPLFYYYNQNIKSVFVVLFYEIIIGCLTFSVINIIFYYILQKILKNDQKVFCVMCILPIFYFTNLNPSILIFFLILLIIIVLDFKYLIRFSLNYIVGIISFIVIILFSYTSIISIYNISYRVLKSKGYDYKIDFKVGEKNKTPNIYWIHCDGMMSSSIIDKYFKSHYKAVDDFFEDNGYYYNKEASLSSGHSTSRALTALLNPKYYDEFYQDYLIDLEKTFLGTKNKTDFIVNYHELSEKRMNNELFKALKKNGYETVVIGDFNSHIAFYSDHYYDYYHYLGMGDSKKQFRYFDSNYNSKFKLDLQLNIIRSSALFSITMFNKLVNETYILDYKPINYNELDLNDYTYTKNTNYWNSRAIFKGIKDSYNKNKSQFTFIDYKLNHFPLTFDKNGNFLSPDKQEDLNYYFDNYVYSSNLLFEMLEYIKTIDKNAVIIVQSDHGINTFKDEFIMKKLNINEKELLEIRNSVMSAVYIPKKYRNGEEKVLSNPLNISRYLVNNFVGENYKYIDK